MFDIIVPSLFPMSLSQGDPLSKDIKTMKILELVATSLHSIIPLVAILERSAYAIEVYTIFIGVLLSAYDIIRIANIYPERVRTFSERVSHNSLLSCYVFSF